MASILACVGLGVSDESDFAALVARVRPHMVDVGRIDGLVVSVWDDRSGARLLFGLRDDDVVDFLPSFVGASGTRLANCRALNDEVAVGDVVDENAEAIMPMAFDLEQHRQMAQSRQAVGGRAAVVALGTGVRVHADADAFAASPDSLLDPDADLDAEPPPRVSEFGLKWPTRMASQSFISHGMFGDPVHATPYARLCGIVERAERRVVEMTGQSFVVARVRTIGFDADVCLAGDEHLAVPAAGQVIAGEVYLVVRIEGFPYGRSARRPKLRIRHR